MLAHVCSRRAVTEVLDVWPEVACEHADFWILPTKDLRTGMFLPCEAKNG